jgi:hypothetical protein
MTKQFRSRSMTDYCPLIGKVMQSDEQLITLVPPGYVHPGQKVAISCARASRALFQSFGLLDRHPSASASRA